MRYISFPRELIKLQISYIKRKGENGFDINTTASDNWDKLLPVIEDQVDGRIGFWHDEGALFNNCFTNQFIYELYLEIPDYYLEQRKEIRKKYTKKEAIDGRTYENEMNRELHKYGCKIWSLQDQILYKYLHDHLNPGEFVEIYKSWIEECDENSWIFGPPTSETVIALNQLPKQSYPMTTLEFGERRKITIQKT